MSLHSATFAGARAPSGDEGASSEQQQPRLDRVTSAPLPDIRPSREKGGKLSREGTMKKPFRLDRSSMTAIERELEAALEGLDSYSKPQKGNESEAAGGGPEGDARDRSWRHRLVNFLHSKPVHTAATVLLILDLILVVVSLELQIQVGSLEAKAYKDCLYEYEKGYAVPLPLVNDTTCNPEGLHTCDPKHSESYEKAHLLHEVELALAAVSCVILTLFLVENLLMILALRWRFFLHFFFVLDIVVVSVSLALELWAIATATFDNFEMLLGFIIVGRMWRFFRVAHGLYFLEHAEEEGHGAKGETEEEFCDKQEASKSAPGAADEPWRLSRLAEEAEEGAEAMKSSSSNAV